MNRKAVDVYCEHVEADGEGLFRLARENDLEGIVAKHKHASYIPAAETTWIKIRNRSYSEWLSSDLQFWRLSSTYH